MNSVLSSDLNMRKLPLPLAWQTVIFHTNRFQAVQPSFEKGLTIDSKNGISELYFLCSEMLNRGSVHSDHLDRPVLHRVYQSIYRWKLQIILDLL
jgi:hypothetical protein